MQASTLIGMALTLTIGLTACSAIEGHTDPQTQRGSVSLEGQQVERESATTIYVTVPSCNGDPVVLDFEEERDRVLVEVVTTQVLSGDREDCLDSVSLELDQPLGDREVIDAVSGSSLHVAQEVVVHLECFDADYPSDPTFDTPEDAFTNGLDTEGPTIGAPEDPDTYQRRDRGVSTVEFEVGNREEQYLVWGITQNRDGAWSMTSLGGCWPTRP